MGLYNERQINKRKQEFVNMYVSYTHGRNSGMCNSKRYLEFRVIYHPRLKEKRSGASEEGGKASY